MYAQFVGKCCNFTLRLAGENRQCSCLKVDRTKQTLPVCPRADHSQQYPQQNDAKQEIKRCNRGSRCSQCAEKQQTLPRTLLMQRTIGFDPNLQVHGLDVPPVSKCRSLIIQEAKAICLIRPRVNHHFDSENKQKRLYTRKLEQEAESR